MVFSSIPVYLDPPNWQQQQNHHNLATNSTESSQLPPLPPPPVLPSLSHVAGPSSAGSGSIRPGSMADRARMAKIPQPETALKCPRCESTNTKFCYFNNYSLTQPRHFCKTCRRYWTRGGALRNVPVGGGCRRNKKTKSNNNNNSNRSKSPSSASAAAGGDNAQSGASSPSGMISPTAPGGSGADILGHFSQNPQAHSSFMASIQNLARFGGGGGGGGALGLNFSEIQGHHHSNNLGFQIGSNNPNPSDQSGVILQGDHHHHHNHHDQWRLQQFPLVGPGHDFEAPPPYPFVEGQGGGMIGSRVSQFGGAGVKMEGRQGLNLSSRPGLGISENNNQFWGGNSNSAWTDLSGLNSSSTTHLL